MPNIANVTVKKADGTTDIVYTALNPAGGDGIPAIFRAQTVGLSPAARPEVRVSGKSVKTGREIRVTAHYPNVKTVSGVETITPGFKFSGTFHLENSQSQVDSDEGASQFANFVASTLVKACASSGFPPV